MYYLISPRGPLRWIDIPITFEEALELGGTLDRIEWKSSEKTLKRGYVELAVRYGRAFPEGIAIDSIHLSDFDRPMELAEVHAKAAASRQHPQIKATDQVIESMSPGWIEHGERLDKAVDASVATAIDEAERKVAELLREAPDPALIQHWEKLGGVY